MKLSWMLTLLLLAASAARPSTLFVSYLSGNNTNPPSGSTAYGTGTITLSDDQTFISATLSMNNLTSLPTFAGIFGPRSQFSIYSPLFLNIALFQNGPSSYFGSAATFVDSSFVSNLRAGGFFFNVFTQANPAGVLVQGAPAPQNGGNPLPPPPTLYSGGEASGAIAEAPEPGTVALTALGVLVIFIGRKR